MARRQTAGALEKAFEQALGTTAVLPGDRGAIALAREYARAIDREPEALTKVGPRLLETLVELGMTPKARATVIRSAGQPPASRLDELRARRERKARG